MDKSRIIAQVEGLYKIIEFIEFRQTRDVSFATVPMQAVARVDAIDRVYHGPGAYSPGVIEGGERPWYMHPGQADNLLVMQGIRFVELYTPEHGVVECFDVYPDQIVKNDQVVCPGPALMCWPAGVFHRIISCPEDGSLSLNFACHNSNFNWKTNFNVYGLNTETGEFQVIREGWKDQKM
jgi:hypothetical protein